jgi:HTH-type transcriptional regulator/antitoxin HigA
MSPKTKQKKRFAEMPLEYEGLIRMFPLRPIQDQVDVENATEILDAMAGYPLTQDQADYLEVLSILVAEYEEKHDPVDLSHLTPLEILAHLLEANDLSASDLGRLLGHRALGSKILRGERALSKAHIATLADRFKVSSALFLAHV